MKRIILGILAHVDSGKTTLSEGMLYQSGKLNKVGRVDHKDTFLDNNVIERDRGITIFSKQAQFDYNDTAVTAGTNQRLNISKDSFSGKMINQERGCSTNCWTTPLR